MNVCSANTLLKNDGVENTWMSHGDSVQQAPEGFNVIAVSEGSPVAAFENLDKKLFGVQWHLEVKHDNSGKQLWKISYTRVQILLLTGLLIR